MTVSSRVSSIIYVGDDSTTVFDVPFRFLENSDLQLSIQATDGSVTNLVLNSDYTVTGANADNGGKVHLTHPVGNQAKLSILRVMDLLQETDYRENERFPAESHERALDKLTFEVQQLQEQSDRAIKVDVFSDADPSEIVYEIEELYDIKDSVIAAANISSDIVTCSHNIEAIQNAEGNANDARNSKIEAQNSAVTAQLMATQAQDWATKTDGKVDGTNYSSKYYAVQASTSAHQAAISAAGTHFKLFQHQWFDYELNDLAWLRADTFSWQSGTVYTNAYNHLVDDIDGIAPATETVGGQTVTFYRAADGHKIVLANQETTVNNIYTAAGVAWYYILDTVNNRFKLPRTKYDFDGLRGNVGDYIPESLPNITGEAHAGILQRGLGWSGSGAFKGYKQSGGNNFPQDGTASSENNGIEFNASWSSSTYQDGAPVQQRGTQQYLYFYVGQYTQSAIEQTAGLNAELFNNKIDIDGNNVITAGANKILNTSSYTTNRILEIPQDIKLELNNGTLTLKAGSKVYVPNGFEADGTTPKFDEVVVASDVQLLASLISTYVNGNYSWCYNKDLNKIQGGNNVWNQIQSNTYDNSAQYCMFYDTTNNIIKYTTDYGATWETGYSLCFCITELTNGVGNVSIDQVFNGFGYIGSTVFALPGVKYEFPNGLNSNGSYANGFTETTSVLTTTYTYTTSTDQSLFIVNNNDIWRCGQFFVVENPPASGFPFQFWYVQSLNCFYSTADGTTVPKSHKGMPFIQIASKIKTDAFFKVTNIDFEGVDGLLTSNANNLSPIGRSYLSGLGMPSGRYIDLTLGASGSTYTAQANGWFCLLKIANDTQHITMLTKDGSFGVRSVASANTATTVCFCPVIKGDIMTLTYSAAGSTTSFKFYYAEGEN